MDSKSKNVSVNHTGDAEVEITADIPAEEMSKHYQKALEDSQKETEIDGFRKGKAPLEMVEKNIGQGVLLQRASENALKEEYPRLLREQEIEPIGQPEVTITKIAPENDLGFRIKTAVMPKVDLPDYKQIAKEVIENNPITEDPEISDEELQETIFNIRASQLMEEKRQKGEEAPSPESLKEEDLPALTDDFVASLGDFSGVDDFHEKIKEHLVRQKKAKEQEKQWSSIIDAIIEKSSITLPSVLVESELDKMTAQLKDDVERAGLEFSDYLSKVQKKEEDIREEWKENAKKRAQTQLILNTIATKEDIKPDPEIVENQTQNLLQQYNEAQPENVRTFVETQLTNEKTLSFLASQASNQKEEATDQKEDKKDKSDKKDK
ncbi:MAG: trigger factor [Patescibacteria group bacterium]